MTYTFTIYGKPATSGSKRAFCIRKGGMYTGKAVLIGDNPREKDWKSLVATAAKVAMSNLGLIEPSRDPIGLQVRFQLPRPKSHFNSKGQLKQQAPEYPLVKPDSTKMLRCIEDALNSVCWYDDTQVCNTSIAKCYGVPGATVTIHTLPITP